MAIPIRRPVWLGRLAGGLVFLGVPVLITFGIRPLVGCNTILHTDDYKVGCASNADCLSAHGEYYICRNDKTCAALLSPKETPDCVSVIGDYKSENAIILGALVTLTGTNKSVGIPMKHSLELALNDFTTSTNGLPPKPGSTERRPLALVVCDDQATVDVGLRAAKHLANDVQVPAILGSAWSGVTINIATKVTIPSKVLLMSAGATSPDITNLDKENNLMWRTIASGEVETAAVSLLVSDVETDLHNTSSLKPTDPVSVSIIYKGDAYGKGYTQATLKTLIFNGHPATDASNQMYFSQTDYGNPGDPVSDPLKYAETAISLIAKAPNIIVVYGVNEAFDNIITPVETGWMAGKPRPRWVFSHSQFTSAATEYLKHTDPSWDLRKRMLGTISGSENSNYRTFRLLYQSQNFTDGTSPDSFGAANAYDAFYVTAYGIVANAGKEVTGPNLAAAFRKVVPPGTSIPVGSANISSAFSLLQSGMNIDFDGASGPLDFDTTTGEAPSEVQVWCIPLLNGGPGAPKNTGYYFDVSRTRVQSFDKIRQNCDF